LNAFVAQLNAFLNVISVGFKGSSKWVLGSEEKLHLSQI